MSLLGGNRKRDQNTLVSMLVLVLVLVLLLVCYIWLNVLLYHNINKF